MTRRPETVAFWWGRLPHWEVVGGRYFVTIHLAGAIPQAGQDRVRELAAELRRLPTGSGDSSLNASHRVFAEIEAWLDRAEDVRHLQEPRIAHAIREAIRFRQGSVWDMLEHVVMPNHLHLFFELAQPGLKSALERFKRWTSNRANRILETPGRRFWQDEWFDHWSRSDAEDDRIIDYIRRNPVKAGLVNRHEDWPFGSWSV